MLDTNAVRVCLHYDLKKLLYSARFYLSIIFVLFVIRDYLLPSKEWFTALSHNITPWIFPHVTNDLFIQMTIMCGLIFILSDAPFLDDAQPFILVRSSRMQWCVGQIAYVLSSSLMYTCVIAVGCAVIMLPNLEWNASWGKVIATLASGQVSLPNYFTFGKEIYETFSPLAAMGLSILYCWLGGCCLGMIMFFVNLKENRIWGIMVAGVLVLQDLFSMMLLPMGSEYFSIISLTRFSVLISNDAFGRIGNMIYSASTMTGVIILFILLSLLRVRKMTIFVIPAI